MKPLLLIAFVLGLASAIFLLINGFKLGPNRSTPKLTTLSDTIPMDVGAAGGSSLEAYTPLVDEKGNISISKTLTYKVPEGITQIYVCGARGGGGDSNSHQTPPTTTTCLPVDTDGKEINIEIGESSVSERDK